MTPAVTVAPPGVALCGIGDEAADAAGDQLAAVARLGWRAIELRTVSGVPVAELSGAVFDDLADRVARAGVRVVAVASGIANWSRPVTGDLALDVAELAALAPRCAALGTRWVRVMSYPNDGLPGDEWGRLARARLRELAYRAEQHGLVLLHENCAGWAGTDASRTLRLLDTVASPALRLLFDTGNGIAYGYDGYRMLTELAEHVVHVHVKDGMEGPRWTAPGRGAARVAECLNLLLDRGYTGAWSIEPHVVHRPHETSTSDGDRLAGFLACGTALEELIRSRVIAGRPGWHRVPGGLTYRPAS